MLNVCQFGHPTHTSRIVETVAGQLWVWDWEAYQGLPGFCPAQDEVSKSIDLQQVWERADTAEFSRILRTRPGLVLDFGSHIGWFTRLALQLGCDVMAFDASAENMRLLYDNVEMIERTGWLETYVEWVGGLDPSLFQLDHVRLFKSDVEGHEDEALNLTRHLWSERKIDYGLWELSPVFEQREGIMAASYAALVNEVAAYGYEWYILKDEGPWYITGKDLTFPQENAWCERVP